MTTNYLLTTPNTQNGIYTGLNFVLESHGGFYIEQQFPQFNMQPFTPVSQYDVTDAIQIRLNARVLNDKLGIIKDASNNNILSIYYYDFSNNLLVDDKGVQRNMVTVNALEFLQNIGVENILSMGKMSTLYSDFNYTVMEYFGAPYGFSSIFDNARDFSVNNGVFDSTAFINLINGITFEGITGTVISDFTGFFTLENVNQHLHYICNVDVFGNRPFGKYNVDAGFIPGDLLFIPNGVTVTLTVDIELEPYQPPNNVGPENLESVNLLVNYINPRNYVRKHTTSTLTNITQVYTVPILIIVDTIENFHAPTFGNSFVDVGTPNNIGNRNWMSVSVSAVGNYQAIADDQGYIYVSGDYGKTWHNTVVIGPTPTISIGISETGRFQTVSNGENIYISSDYGQTWTEVFNLGSSNISVSVSLHGKYQTVLSCGDTIYTSKDYGQTWDRLDEVENAELYNSIETFPTGGVSLSYTGQIQAIACETIWLSKDYGVTWSDVFQGQYFNDHNWDSISISSTGQIMTAVDSGNNIYNSQDYGTTWTQITHPLLLNKEWECISISAESTYQTAIEIGGALYFSTDKGVTWTKSRDPKVQSGNWSSVSVSANGQYQTVVEYGGSVYTCSLV